MSETKESLVTQLVEHVDQSLRNHVAAMETTHAALQKVHDLPLIREMDRVMIPVIWKVYESIDDKITEMIAKALVARHAVPDAVSQEQVTSMDEAIELVTAKDKAIRELRKMIEVKFGV